MPRIARRIAVFCAAVSLAVCAVARGQGAPEPELRGVWQAALDWDTLEGVVVRFRETRYATMSAAELAAAQAEIAAFPEHPRRFWLEEDSRRLANGPDVVEYVIWALDGWNWRISTTERTRDMTADTALTEDVLWSMGAGTVQVFDPSLPPPPSGDVRTLGDEIALRGRQVLLGHLGLEFRSPLTLEGVSVEGDKAHLWAANEEGRRWDYWCERGPGGRRWFVTRAVNVAVPRAPELNGTEWRYTGWSSHTGLAAPLAAPTTVEKYSPSGRLLIRIDEIKIEALSPEEFRAAAAVPSFEGSDVLRGAGFFHVLRDFRPGAGTQTIVTDAGSATQAMSAAELGARPPANWRVVGWVVAAILVTSLVGVRLLILRRSRGGASSVQKGTA